MFNESLREMFVLRFCYASTQPCGCIGNIKLKEQWERHGASEEKMMSSPTSEKPLTSVYNREFKQR